MEPDVLERVLESSRRMAETRQLEPLLDYAMLEAIQLVGAQSGFMVLLNPDNSWDFRVNRYQEASGLAPANDPISMAVVTRVMGKNEPVVLEDALSEPAFASAVKVMDLKLRSVMCVPLISRGSTIGAIFVESRSARRMFQPRQVLPLIFFANQAAVSIDNAMLNEQLEARVDERTRELQNAKEHMEQAWHEAVEANRVRTTFLGNVAHDVRAPLSVAVTTLTLMSEGAFGKLNTEQQTWVRKTLRGVQHSLDLIRDMFDLAKIEMGQFSLLKEEVDLQRFLLDVFEIAQGLPWPDDVSLRLEIPADLPRIQIDPIRLRQVLMNLFTNALKFTVEGTVTLYARRQSGQPQVLIGIKDTGEGIPPNKLTDLFDRFRQVDDNLVRRQMGTGLGLAISKELIEMHGGTIWAESEKGKGADFRFVLPY